MILQEQFKYYKIIKIIDKKSSNDFFLGYYNNSLNILKLKIIIRISVYLGYLKDNLNVLKI